MPTWDAQCTNDPNSFLWYWMIVTTSVTHCRWYFGASIDYVSMIEASCSCSEISLNIVVLTLRNRMEHRECIKIQFPKVRERMLTFDPDLGCTSLCRCAMEAKQMSEDCPQSLAEAGVNVWPWIEKVIHRVFHTIVEFPWCESVTCSNQMYKIYRWPTLKSCESYYYTQVGW